MPLLQKISWCFLSHVAGIGRNRYPTLNYSI